MQFGQTAPLYYADIQHKNFLPATTNRSPAFMIHRSRQSGNHAANQPLRFSESFCTRVMNKTQKIFHPNGGVLSPTRQQFDRDLKARSPDVFPPSIMHFGASEPATRLTSIRASADSRELRSIFNRK